jgi:hypothetical protein
MSADAIRTWSSLTALRSYRRSLGSHSSQNRIDAEHSTPNRAAHQFCFHDEILRTSRFLFAPIRNAACSDKTFAPQAPALRIY